MRTRLLVQLNINRLHMGVLIVRLFAYEHFGLTLMALACLLFGLMLGQTQLIGPLIFACYIAGNHYAALALSAIVSLMFYDAVFCLYLIYRAFPYLQTS